MSNRMSVVGQVLADRYQIEEMLGKGSMGAVYSAFDRQMGTLCAIKTLHRLVEAQDEAYTRFVNEAAAITQLFHPHIVQVREFCQDKSGTPFLVMELLRGRDLYAMLQTQDRLPTQQTVEILRQVGSALHTAHCLGIVHRDVKPKNIFLCRQVNSYGEEFEVVKVVDFGLSKFIGRKQRHATGMGTILGTPEYLSPEATLGLPGAVDYRADQWAMGVMAYRMLSGRLPFDSDDLVQLLLQVREAQPTPLGKLLPGLSPHVEAAVHRALSKHKEDRFPSVQDFVRALEGLPPVHRVMEQPLVQNGPMSIAPTMLIPHLPMEKDATPVPLPLAMEVSRRQRASIVSAGTSGSVSLPGRRSAIFGIRPRRVVAATVIGALLGLLGPLWAHHIITRSQKPTPVTSSAQSEVTQPRAVKPPITQPPMDTRSTPWIMPKSIEQPAEPTKSAPTLTTPLKAPPQDDSPRGPKLHRKAIHAATTALAQAPVTAQPQSLAPPAPSPPALENLPEELSRVKVVDD